MEYKEIFNPITPLNLIQSTKFIRYNSHLEDEDDLTLIGECNPNGKVQYHNIERNKLMYEISPTPFHRAESMRVGSMTNPPMRKENFESGGGRRHTGRLKFFDENKNYG